MRFMNGYGGIAFGTLGGAVFPSDVPLPKSKKF